MKKVIFYNTMADGNELVKNFLLVVSQFKDIKCDLSAFDVDINARRKSRPLLCTCIDNKITSTDIYNFDELAALGKEGFTLISAESFEQYAGKFANELKYS